MSSAEDAYRQHRGRIYRFFRSRVASHDDAEDLTQRVFLDAVVALSEGKPAPDSVLGWLYAVAQRRLVDEIRRRNRAAPVAMQASPPIRAADYGSDVTGHLASAMANLPDTQRRVVALRLLRGVPFSEISTEIGISEAAAKMRFTRGIEQVRRHLIEAGLDGRDQ